MMKKIFLTLIAILTSTILMAQNYELQVFHNGQSIFSQPVSTADSMKLANGLANIHYSSLNWNRNIGQLDSIVFRQIPSDDSLYSDTVTIDTTAAIRIHWGESAVVITNPFANDGVNITASGNHVAVNSTTDESNLVYILSGSCADGGLEITSSKKLILCLDGLNLSHSDGPAIDMLSDKRVVLHLMESTISNISDGAASTGKGAIQFKGKLDIQGSGTLNISGLAKHGIQSSGNCNMIWGNVNVLTAVKDGLNVDDFVMQGGNLIVSASGDGIDGDKGYIEINHGTIEVTCNSDDTKGITCDSTLTIKGGHVTVTCSGNQSKCIKSNDTISIVGGTIQLYANGSVVLEPIGSGFDPSYCTGIKGDKDVYFLGGNTTITCATSNAGGKGVNANGNIYINNGELTITAQGASASYTNENGATDSYNTTCLKSDANIIVNGGMMELTAGGRAISCDSNFTQQGGKLILNTTADGAVISGSGTSATDGYTSACVKADNSIVILGGLLTGHSTGKGGRGLVSDNLTVGSLNADDDDIDINIYTSGAPVNTTSGGGGGWPGGGGSSSSAWKGLPKGIKIANNITINSGHVSVYCSQTSGDPTAEAIESKGSIYIHGGEIEANSYDDAINAAQYIEITGGKVWAYARGNDGIDCNGTSITITGGLVIAQGSEVGIDADTENGGRFNITGGTIISKGGNMGAWDTPTCTGTQRYIQASVTPTNGFAVKSSDGTEMLVFKAPAVSGSGFIDQTDGTGTKPPPGGGGGGGGSSSGVGISLPNMTTGTYSVYSSVTITGGDSWHGYYTGATCTTSGSATSATTR